jgi:hypothetical protein
MLSVGESYLAVILVGISFYRGFCGYSIGYYWPTIFGSDRVSAVGLHRRPIGLRECDPIEFLR